MKLPVNLQYNNGALFMDGISLQELAEKYGTPLYVYSADRVRRNMNSMKEGLGDRPGIFCYAVKANSNGEILRLIREEGGGADIVSGGELYRALRAGIEPGKIVFSGVGKTREEIREAIQAEVLLLAAESEDELRTISRVAQEMGRTVSVSIRANPDVDPGTHPYISTGLRENKFGVSHRRVAEVFRIARELPGLEPRGLGFHIGSQVTDLSPYREAARLIGDLAREVIAQGAHLRFLDVGGGLGITYQDETPPPAQEYVRAVSDGIDMPELTLIFEPGRSLVGEAGVLLTRVLYSKINEGKKFYICDAAMNDLMRPALYRAYHHVLPAALDRPLDESPSDLVGPVCETGDFLAQDRILPGFRNDDLAVLTAAGAYGFSMSSNYNSRRRAAEVLLENGTARLIRERETYEDLVRREIDPS